MSLTTRTQLSGLGLILCFFDFYGPGGSSYFFLIQVGDCRNAFVQSSLSEDEVTIVRQPSDCPLSEPPTYWYLHKSLYSLHFVPCSWYNLITSHLKSLEIGLERCRNDPCIIVGNPLAGKAPLYLVLYVNDFVFSV